MGDLGGGLAIREKAISLVKDAVEKDKAADYASAFKLYMSALTTSPSTSSTRRTR